MKKIIGKRIVFCMIAAAILFQLSAPIVSACASGRRTDSETGWTFGFPANYTHTGTKSITYYYGDVYSGDYHTRFTEGKNLWGTNISMQRTTNSNVANVIFRVDTSFPSAIESAYGVTQYRLSGTPPMHTTQWTVAINKPKFDSLSTYQKKVVTAHEIGHVYGLGHIGFKTQIMYFNPLTSMNVTEIDKRGIDLMTHKHNCSSSTSSMYNTYERVDTTLHKKRCKVCKSFLYEPHTNGITCTFC